MCAHTMYHAKFYIHELITTFETQTQKFLTQKHAQVWMFSIRNYYFPHKFFMFLSTSVSIY